MERVYVVSHVHELPSGEEDVKFIGVYGTSAAAEAAVDRAKKRPGFRDTPEGFHVGEYVVGKDHWEEGFVTWTPAEKA